MPFQTVVAKTIEYLAVPSVVGYEKNFTRFLKADFEKLGLVVKEHDGLIEVSVENPNSLIISAHIDRHGLISVGKNQYGYAAEYVKEIKYNEVSIATHKLLQAVGARFNGEEVIAYDPETGNKLGEGVISVFGPQAINDSCIFSIDGMREIPINMPVAYARTAISDGYTLQGQIDNVVSLGVIYTLFQNGYQGTALLTCEEEIGKSWVHITNWLVNQKIETQELFIIDTSPYRESAPVEAGMVILRNRDKSAVFNPDLTAKIKQRCTELLIPFQFKDDYLTTLGTDVCGLGSTELGRIIQNSNNRWSGTTIQIPTTEYHTSHETTSRESIERYYSLLQNILVNQIITTQI